MLKSCKYFFIFIFLLNNCINASNQYQNLIQEEETEDIDKKENGGVLNFFLKCFTIGCVTYASIKMARSLLYINGYNEENNFYKIFDSSIKVTEDSLEYTGKNTGNIFYWIIDLFIPEKDPKTVINSTPSQVPAVPSQEPTVIITTNTMEK
jgi:hypothetical protein